MKPRILFIVPLPPPVHGSSAVCRSIQESSLIHAEIETDFVNLSPSRHIREISRGSWRKGGRYLVILCRVFWRLCLHRYDLCYIAPSVTPRGVFKDIPVIILCKLFGRKTILHLHGKGFRKYSRGFWFRRMCSVMFRSSKVILLSELLYQDIGHYVKRHDVFICPNGIPVIPDIPTDTPASDCPRLCFLSNLVPSKGVLELMDACRLLKARGCNFGCDLIGRDSAQLSYSQLADEIAIRGLESIVICHGAQYGDQKIRLLRQADIFVFPTFYSNECFPLVILEAMQMHLPIVTTPEGAIADMVIHGGNGYLVQQHDIADLADKLEFLLQNPVVRKQMGESGDKHFREHFTQAAFETTLLQILLEVYRNSRDK